ncbi:MAG: OPT family oligopeptide transporter, partial [Thermoprotei archaeon]
MSSGKAHPKAFEPSVLTMSIGTSLLGAIIGLELITRVGITPNTSIIGALIAIGVGLIPISIFRGFRDIYRQNLVQTAISAATFTAANVCLLAIGIPWLLGYKELVLPFLIGVIIAAFIDVTTAYWIFDSEAYPASNPWPPGIATAEAIKAAAERGKRALLLLYGGIGGAALRYLGIPADVIGITFIANIWAITMFGIGLILRGYSVPLFGVDINKLYVPHGIMIGAGIASVIQIIMIIRGRRSKKESSPSSSTAPTSTETEVVAKPTVPPELLKKRLLRSLGLFIGGALVTSLATGLYTGLNAGALIGWILFAGGMALLTTLICGLSGMHAG